jgi:hypothetical protein
MKQETLEEVALKLYQYQSENPPYTIITPKAKVEGFIEGAKWQQEQDNKEIAMWKLAVEQQEKRCIALTNIIKKEKEDKEIDDYYKNTKPGNIPNPHF